jgi:PAS domain S-box-containing protein
MNEKRKAKANPSSHPMDKSEEVWITDLRASEHKYRTLIENLPQKIFTKDRNSVCVSCNENYARDLGISSEEFAGKTDYDFFPRDLADKYRADDRRILETGLPETLEERYIHKGREVWVETVKTPIKDDQGKPIGILGIFSDITERKQAREKLERYARELERSNADLEQFAYVASHDLQEPLRMVSGYTQLLARRYKGRLDDEADEFIAFAVDGANRMQRLINDLLTYSRVNTRGNPLHLTDAAEALAKARLQLSAAIEECNALVTNDRLPMLMADGRQLAQLLQNLIGNALKFRGKEPPHVHISVERNATEWIFSVRDNGIGIDPEYHERIFEIFQRLHRHDEYPGTGIGLALCRRIVQRHGGKIWVESEPGKGSTFRFSIPVMDTNREEASDNQLEGVWE